MLLLYYKVLEYKNTKILRNSKNSKLVLCINPGISGELKLDSMNKSTPISV